MFDGNESASLNLSALVMIGLIYTYPFYRALSFVLSKVGLVGKRLANMTFFILIALGTAYSATVHGLVLNALLLTVSVVLCSAYWLFLDYRRMAGRSTIIKALDNRWFRYIFGVVVCILVFTVSLGFKSSTGRFYDYVVPLTITVLYMVFVYRKARKKHPRLLNNKNSPSAEASGR